MQCKSAHPKFNKTAYMIYMRMVLNRVHAAGYNFTLLTVMTFTAERQDEIFSLLAAGVF